MTKDEVFSIAIAQVSASVAYRNLVSEQTRRKARNEKPFDHLAKCTYQRLIEIAHTILHLHCRHERHGSMRWSIDALALLPWAIPRQSVHQRFVKASLQGVPIEWCSA